MRLILAISPLIIALSACAAFPALDGTVSPAHANAPFPDLVPIASLIQQANVDGSASALVEAAISGRIANLRASVHVLVLLAFKREELTKIQAKNPGKRIDVDHRASASKHNNVPTNLDWVTRSENMRRSFYGLDFDEDDEEEAQEV